VQDIKGMVSKIERFAIEDGEGIRTLVFLKGCPLSCIWCANPETKNLSPEIAYFKDTCIGCGKCAEVCPQKAISYVKDEGLMIDRNKCDNCGLCAEVCPTHAKVLIGKSMTSDEIIAEVKKDSVFYQRSAGGITISGGEPTFQEDFLIELLAKCQAQSLNTVIETCGYTTWANLKNIAQYTDLIFYDLKHMNPLIHKKLTGVSNKLILQNLENLSKLNKPIIVRVPLIPSYNDSLDNIENTVDFVKNLDNIQRLEILPYHRLGRAKYESLDREYELKELLPPNSKSLAWIIDLGVKKGVQIQIGA
jgi:pyruvate formate lyase activating enzyme